MEHFLEGTQQIPWGDKNVQYLCWRRLRRGCDCQMTCELDLGNPRLLPPFSVLGMYLLPTTPTLVAIPRTQSWETRYCWDHLDWILDWTQLRYLYKLLSFWWVQRSTQLTATQDKPHMWVTLSAKPASTNLECSASFFSLSLPSGHGGQFSWVTPEVVHQQSYFGKLLH